MRINTNLAALNSYNNLNRTDNALNRSLERLSSGLRINRASDDAAGLAISEKMRGQIRGLNQAQRNAQDGISMIQTAEGALNESHAILQRMRELAVQAANDTYTAADRQEIQREIDQLTQELDRIANTTEFNTKQLLDGSASALTSTDRLSTEVFIRDGLRVEDQFGQKAVGGGNFNIEIEADPGVAQVQKTDQMKVKHEAGPVYEYESLVEESQATGQVTDQGADDITVNAQGGAHTDYNDITLVFEASSDTSAITAVIDSSTTVGDITISVGSQGSDITADDINQAIANAQTAGNTAADWDNVDLSNILVSFEGEFTASDAAGISNIELSGGQQELNWNVASLSDDVTITFAQTSGTLTVGVTGNDVTITLSDDGNDSLEDIIQAIAEHEEASQLIHMEYEDLAIDFNASIGTAAVAQLTARGEIELEDAQLPTDFEPLQYTDLTDGEEDLMIAALYGDVELVVNEVSGQNTVGVEVDGSTITVTIGTSGHTSEDIAQALLEDGDAHQMISIMYNDGTAVEAGTYEIAGPGEFAEIGDIANLDTTISDIDRFWDASGNFLVEDPQTITMVQGDGSRASFTIFENDTIEDIQDKMNAAIGEGLGQNDYLDNANGSFVEYITEESATTSGHGSVAGTFVIRSAVTGSPGEINFVGGEDVINALSLTTIQDAAENQFTINVNEAHTGEAIAEDVRITGNELVGVVHENVDVRFDNMAGIGVEVDANGDFVFNSLTDGSTTTVHLADNTTVFQIGANPLQDVASAIGDMRAAALGVDNIQVTDRETANRSISLLDRAIDRVSAERSKLGAIQNRLEHTIANLGVAAENLTAAESRVRDLDMAAEMMEFTKQQIMTQAGTAMLAQANMKPQTVLQLLG